MATETIKLKYQDNICTISLNRPQAFNSMDENMAGDFQKALEEIKEDLKIRALIVTGTGKAFCAGADLKMLSHRDLPDLQFPPQ